MERQRPSIFLRKKEKLKERQRKRFFYERKNNLGKCFSKNEKNNNGKPKRKETEREDKVKDFF